MSRHVAFKHSILHALACCTQYLSLLDPLRSILAAVRKHRLQNTHLRLIAIRRFYINNRPILRGDLDDCLCGKFPSVRDRNPGSGSPKETILDISRSPGRQCQIHLRGARETAVAAAEHFPYSSGNRTFLMYRSVQVHSPDDREVNREQCNLVFLGISQRDALFLVVTSPRDRNVSPPRITCGRTAQLHVTHDGCVLMIRHHSTARRVISFVSPCRSLVNFIRCSVA